MLAMEGQFATQNDPLFRYYLYTSGLICLSMIAIKLIIPNIKIPRKLIWSFSATVVMILVSLILTFWTKHRLRYARCRQKLI